MLTATQKATALAIVNLFETSSVRGDYGAVTVIEGDSGHLTFGRSQTTLASGGGPGLLTTLLAEYCAAPGARYAHLLQPYVQRCGLPDLALDHEQRFHNLLRASADDVVMRDVQDQFFDVRYWEKALVAAASHGLSSPLAVATVYDSLVHGSWAHVRGLADGNAGGTPDQVGQESWLPVYVQTRRHWLATHPTKPVLHSTVYRMDALQRLIDFELWDLPLPIVVRGAEINLVTMAAEPPGCFSGPAPGTRALAVQGQMLRGLDVRLFQLGLSEAGCEVVADGLFGFGARRALHEHQQRQGLPASDVADAALVEALARSVG